MPSHPPTWALALTYWLHMLATLAWPGGLLAIFLIVYPAAKRTLKPAEQLAFIAGLQRRLEPLAWFSMALLAATGLFQMSVNPHYDGFLSTTGQWSLAILGKHLLGILMVVVSAVQTWEVLPAIQRGLLRMDKGAVDPTEVARLQKLESRLLRLNVLLSVLILGATAFARAS